jgi:hypothetical protein
MCRKSGPARVKGGNSPASTVDEISEKLVGVGFFKGAVNINFHHNVFSTERVSKSAHAQME